MTSDLLGDPIPETPAMNASLPWRVWRMNHVTDCVMARSEREAIACYLEWRDGLGDARTEGELRSHGHIEDVRELTDQELVDNLYSDCGGPPKCTFAEELARMASFAKAPNFFASTEF